MKRPTCPYCNPLKIDNHPELVPSGHSDPKVYRCPMGNSCKGLKDRPAEFNYFDINGTPIPYTPPTKNTAGYSPQKAIDPKKIVKNPWVNDPANAPNLKKQVAGKIFFNPLRKPSLTYCLRELGAENGEISGNDKGIGVWGKRKRRYYKPTRDLQDAELLDWAEYMYKEKLKKFHPDLHPDKVGLYTEYCKHIGEMIQRVRKILLNRM